jgi:homoserine O-acetyltransferase/O-succinyltransferase
MNFTKEIDPATGEDIRTQSSQGSVGKVVTQYHTFGSDNEKFILESGESLCSVTIAYQAYGKLNAEKSNAVLIVHALSGDAHAAGFENDDDRPGWWDDMIGPGKAFDTDRYFMICSNIIGGCMGSTGPSSTNPETGKPYGIDFPILSIDDMVNAQVKLVQQLGIEKLLAVAGGSMGGMQVLSWLTRHPDLIRSAIPIATAVKHTPQQIAFDEVGRQAIMADPNWKGGDYYGHPHPDSGLGLARMIGHITYMSDKSMAEKFGRRVKFSRHNREALKASKFAGYFTVEDYLQRRGENFTKRFDANSYLYITRAMDEFDASRGDSLHKLFKGMKPKLLVIAFKSDWLYPAYQSKEIVRAGKLAGADVTYCEIDSNYGHDAFLLEIEEESHLIRHFLKRISNGNGTEH